MIHNMIHRVNHSTGETQVLSLHNRLTNLSHPGIGNEEIKAHLPTPRKRFSEINNLIIEDDDTLLSTKNATYTEISLEVTKKTTNQEGIIHKTFQKIVKKISNVLKGYKKIDKNNT